MLRRLPAPGLALLIAAAAPPAASAQVGPRAALDLCRAQPALDPSNLAPELSEMLRGPHDRAMDRMSPQHLLQVTQASRAASCAEAMVAHPDVFAAISARQFVFDYSFVDAWAAFNDWCRDDVTASCIARQVGAATALRAASTPRGRERPSLAACRRLLARDSDPVQRMLCMDAAEATHADDLPILHCAATLPWHAEADGAAAGLVLARCARAGG